MGLDDGDLAVVHHNPVVLEVAAEVGDYRASVVEGLVDGSLCEVVDVLDLLDVDALIWDLDVYTDWDLVDEEHLYMNAMAGYFPVKKNGKKKMYILNECKLQNIITIDPNKKFGKCFMIYLFAAKLNQVNDFNILCLFAYLCFMNL